MEELSFFGRGLTHNFVCVKSTQIPPEYRLVEICLSQMFSLFTLQHNETKAIQLFYSGPAQNYYFQFPKKPDPTTRTLQRIFENNYIQHIPTSFTVTQISCAYEHTFIVSEDGGVWGLGWNEYGQCGFDPKADPIISSFRQVEGLGHAISASAGRTHSGVIVIQKETALKKVMMFGRNQYGELGLGETEIGDFRPPTPVKWVGKESIQQVSCGDSYSIFIFDNRQVYGMGLNLYLQLDCFVPTLINVPATHKVLSSIWHTLFLTTLGQVFLSGWVGLQTEQKIDDALRPTPTLIPFAEKIKDIAISHRSSLFLTETGQVFQGHVYGLKGEFQYFEQPERLCTNASAIFSGGWSSCILKKA